MSFSLSKVASTFKSMSSPFGDSGYYSMIGGTSVKRCEIELLDAKGTKLFAQFNPSKLTITRGTANWSGTATGATNVPVLQFTGNNADTLGIDLMFDASEEKVDGGGSVMSLIKAFHALSVPYDFGDKGNVRPPVLRFRWGSDLKFDGVIRDLSYEIMMFTAKGDPMRAVVKLMLTGEFLSKAAQVEDVVAAKFEAPKIADAKSAASDAKTKMDALKKP
jgi:hypothetical protein